MRNSSLKILLAICLVTLGEFVKAQGCSDAGFCTLNSFKPGNSNVTEMKSQLKVGFSFGSADYSISILGNYLEYSRKLNEKLVIDTKLTSLAQNGNDISVFGLSDLFLNTNFKINESLTLTFGTKIPLSNGNKVKDDLPLPMDYQASLGTLDLILGVGYKIKTIQFVAALQQPLTQNKNEFISENYTEDSKLQTFQSTNEFKRSGDVLLRISYPIKLGEKFRISPSVLPIYHLANDKFTDNQGIEKEIVGSQGLTLNGNLYLDYELNAKNTFQLNMGKPFLVRDARPDGLTREFVVNLEYKILF